jgi:hypothetical protein
LIDFLHRSFADTPRGQLARRLEVYAVAQLLFFTLLVAVSVVAFAASATIGAWCLLPASVGTLLGIWLLTRTNREAGVVAAFAAATVVGAGAVSMMVPDGSWDGLVYHQEAVLRLAAGWNPLYEDASAYGAGNEIYINHYPKASWIAGAVVLLASGSVEAGKLFNLTLVLAAMAVVMAAALRLTGLRVIVAAVVALVAGLNPVALAQGATFYVDGGVASLLTIVVAGLIAHVSTLERRFLVLALLAAGLAINLKFTALAYVVVLLGCGVIAAWWRHGMRTGWGMARWAAVAGAVGVLVLGYSPYVRNVVEQGHLFYPVMGAPQYTDTTSMRPVNMNDHGRVGRFLVSSFSRSETVRPPSATRLKFPLSMGAQERRGVYGADLESGGFGPLFGGMLLLAATGLAALVWRRDSRRAGSLVLMACICVMGSVFVHGETWWARYVPQAWLVPMLIAIVALMSPAMTLRRWTGYAIVALATVNLLVIGANVAWRQLLYTLDTQLTLLRMSAAPGPVTVYLGPFRPLRQRLREAGVHFILVDAALPESSVRQVFPAPGNGAYWQE